MRTDLPPECSEPLDYASTIETLKLLEGEEMVLFIEGGLERHGRGGTGLAASRIQAKGILRHYAYGWAEGFALSDGARVLLYEPDFVRGHLTTHENVNFFVVDVDLANAKFSLGNNLETDEFDLFPEQ